MTVSLTGMKQKKQSEDTTLGFMKSRSFPHHSLALHRETRLIWEMSCHLLNGGNLINCAVEIDNVMRLFLRSFY